MLFVGIHQPCRIIPNIVLESGQTHQRQTNIKLANANHVHDSTRRLSVIVGINLYQQLWIDGIAFRGC